MISGQIMPFLRPYLWRGSSAAKSGYARFYVIAQESRCKHVSGGTLPLRSSQRLYSSSAKNQPGQGSDESTDSLTASLSRISKLQESGALRYPRIGSQENRMRVPQFIKIYENVAKDEVAAEEVTLNGRIMSIRRASSKLVFVDLESEFQRVQILLNYGSISASSVELDQFKAALKPLLRGDLVSFTGHATRSSTGELSLKATQLPQLLSPSLAPLPEKLNDEETMIQNRHVAMLVNRRTADILRMRSHVIRFIRDFFHERDFLEVQTPILADYAGGAVARPFLTSASEFPSKELALRIAPELWLKRLVVGGFDKVFEIGPSFRNEGIDITHNPEFMTCEFYSAYFSLTKLMSVTQDLVVGLVNEAQKQIGTKMTSLDHVDLDYFSRPFAPIEFVPALEAKLGVQFPDLSQPDALDTLKQLLRDQSSAKYDSEVSLNKYLDHLASQYLEPESNDRPVFIINHPACMSPLSKSFVCPKSGQLVSARAELIIKGREIANMYEEENDPFEQRRKFELQVEARNQGIEADELPAQVDESYVQALEHGLPPTGGWGCGIDRLVMLVTGASKISDTLSFGNLKNVVSLADAARLEVEKKSRWAGRKPEQE